MLNDVILDDSLEVMVFRARALPDQLHRRVAEWRHCGREPTEASQSRILGLYCGPQNPILIIKALLVFFGSRVYLGPQIADFFPVGNILEIHEGFNPTRNIVILSQPWTSFYKES